MAILDKVLGNASEVDAETIKAEVGYVLLTDEIIEGGYRVYRDLLVFTNRRLLLIDKQGITGTKLGITTIPYRNINFFTVNTAGSLDFDSELAISIKGAELPITKAFKKGDLIFKVQAALVWHTTNI